MKIRIATILFFCGMLQFGHAQQNASAAGGEASGAGGTVSFSVGQVDYITPAGSGGNSNQGVQQPYVFTTKVNNIKDADLGLSVFPNPSADVIVLNASSSVGATRIELHDALGKLLLQKEISDTQTRIDMKPYSNGAYFLSVFKKNDLLKEFKVVKSVE